MRTANIASLIVAALAFVAPPAQAFVVRIGDTVYVDGKKYTWEEWQKIRNDPGARSAAEQVATAKPQPPLAASEPRAGSCSTRGYFDEFPADEERFDCSAGLGLRTRDELLRQGWKIDLVEKIPAGGEARSSRGLPLFRYKLVISR